MWKKVVRGLAIVAACIGTPALGGTLVERFGETHAELPDYLQFDCSDSNRGWIDAFGKKMRVPRHFERPNEASSALEWRIRLGNGPVSTQYASIRTDSMDSALEMFADYPSVSAPLENAIGAHVKVREIAPGEVGESHGIILLANDEYLIVEALVPMDWQSLLDCFEPLELNRIESTSDHDET